MVALKVAYLQPFSGLFVGLLPALPRCINVLNPNLNYGRNKAFN